MKINYDIKREYRGDIDKVKSGRHLGQRPAAYSHAYMQLQTGTSPPPDLIMRFHWLIKTFQKLVWFANMHPILTYLLD